MSFSYFPLYFLLLCFVFKFRYMFRNRSAALVFYVIKMCFGYVVYLFSWFFNYSSRYIFYIRWYLYSGLVYYIALQAIAVWYSCIALQIQILLCVGDLSVIFMLSFFIRVMFSVQLQMIFNLFLLNILWEDLDRGTVCELV